MQRTILAVTALMLVMAATPSDDLEVVSTEGGVTVSINDEQTYAEYEYDTPLAGTVTRTTHVGIKVDEGCEYSGSGSAKATETRVWTEREVSNDTETCTMVTEGAWVIDTEPAFEDPDWEWDGNITGRTNFLGDNEVWTRSRVRWDTGPNCVTAWFRTSGWFWEPHWVRTGWLTYGAKPACGTNGAWASINRTTYSSYESENQCPDFPPEPVPDLSISHWVSFTGKKAGASSWAWTLQELGYDPLCMLFTTETHTVDPS